MRLRNILAVGTLAVVASVAALPSVSEAAMFVSWSKQGKTIVRTGAVQGDGHYSVEHWEPKSYPGAYHTYYRQ